MGIAPAQSCTVTGLAGADGLVLNVREKSKSVPEEFVVPAKTSLIHKFQTPLAF